MIERVKDWF